MKRFLNTYTYMLHQPLDSRRVHGSLEDPFLQGVALGFQVAEGGTDEGAEGAGRLDHVDLPVI